MTKRPRPKPPYYPPTVCLNCPQRFAESRCRKHDGQPVHKVYKHCVPAIQPVAVGPRPSYGRAGSPKLGRVS